jgi:hypothetical protein
MLQRRVHLKRRLWTALIICVGWAASGSGSLAHAQAALLMEDAFGVGGALNPTGHDAVYFARICAESPVKLRRCRPGEEGAVIARYRDVGGYDWLAVPLTPYLFSVENKADTPAWADRAAVRTMRRRYIESHFYGMPVQPWGKPAPRGNWNELVGTLYDRRVYAFRFDTTEEQDDALIEKLNNEPNHSHFSLVVNNCSDFAAKILGFYFPGVFHRRWLPDARITTPLQNSWELMNYAKKHPELQLSVVAIAQIRGSRIPSRRVWSVAGALLTSGDLAPVVWFCPPAAGVVFADYLIWGRYPLHLKNVPKIRAEDLSESAESDEPVKGADTQESRTAIEGDSALTR